MSRRLSSVSSLRWSLGIASLAVCLGCPSNESAPASNDAPPAPSAQAPSGPAQPSNAAAGGQAEDAARESSAASASPGVRADGTVVSAVAWFDGSLEQAKARAAAEDKLLFVDVGAYWCPPCQELDEKVFVLPKVGAALAERYIAVHVDAEKGEGPEFVEEHHVQAFPTMLVLEPTGMEKGRMVDFQPADALLAGLARIEAGESVLADAIEAVEANPDDMAKRQRLGHLYVLASDRERAEQEFVQVLEADPRNTLGLASKVLYDRALFIRYKLDRDVDGAIADFKALQEQFPQSKEATRAYRQIGRLHHRAGRDDEAIASLDAMLALDPTDTGLASSYGWFAFRENCRPKRGLEVVEGAIKMAPDDAGLRYLRGELSHLAGDDAAALVAMTQASALEPKSAFFRRQVRRFSPAGAEGSGAL